MTTKWLRSLWAWLFRDPYPIMTPELRRALDDPRTRYRIVDAVLAREKKEAHAERRR